MARSEQFDRYATTSPCGNESDSLEIEWEIESVMTMSGNLDILHLSTTDCLIFVRRIESFCCYSLKRCAEDCIHQMKQYKYSGRGRIITERKKAVSECSCSTHYMWPAPTIRIRDCDIQILGVHDKTIVVSVTLPTMSRSSH